MPRVLRFPSDDYVGPGVRGALVESYRTLCLIQKPIFIYPAASIVAQVVTRPLQRAAERYLRVTTLRPCPDSQPTNDQDSPVQQGIEERDSHHGVSPFREQFQSLLTPSDELNCACRVYSAWAVPFEIFSTTRSQTIGNAWSARDYP